MDVDKLLLFIPIAIVYIAAPGPAVLLAITNGVIHGPKKTLYSIYGNATGHLITAGFTILGIQAIMMSSETLFAVLKTFSVAFLIYKGVQSFATKSIANREMQLMDDTARGSLNRNQLYLQGLLMSVFNPKPILFFTALFPQFISPNYPPIQQLMTLTLTFMVISFTCLSIYAVIASQMKSWLGIPFWNSVFNKVAGATFITLGGMIAVSA